GGRLAGAVDVHYVPALAVHGVRIVRGGHDDQPVPVLARDPEIDSMCSGPGLDRLEQVCLPSAREIEEGRMFDVPVFNDLRWGSPDGRDGVQTGGVAVNDRLPVRTPPGTSKRARQFDDECRGASLNRDSYQVA